MKHTSGEKLALTDYLSEHTIEEAMIEEAHKEEHEINFFSEFF